MDDRVDTLRILTLLGLGAGTIALVLNMCAMDRWEKQLIQNRADLEDLREAVDAMGTGVAVAPSTSGGSECTPGEPTSFSASGWESRRAPVLCVEGRLPGAPFTIGQKEAYSGKHQGDTYVNRRASAPQSLNRYATNEGDARRIGNESQQAMMVLDAKNPSNVLPNLATSWEISDDKLTYTFHLRKGVLHADGRPFTSEDVVFSFAVIRDPEVTADHLRPGFEDVQSVTAIDDHTVEVKYRKKYWRGLLTFGLNLRVLNSGWYEEFIPKYAGKFGVDEFSTTPGTPGFGEVFNKIRIPSPATGPYYFRGEDYTPGDGTELVQNPFYWGIQVTPTRFNFDKLRWIYISDEVAAFEEFRKGAFDVSVVDHAQWDDELSKDETIAQNAEHFVYDHTGLGHSAVTWNNRQPPFDDPRVRRAMTHMIDREWMKKEITRGNSTIAVCNSKRTYPTYSLDLEPHSFDLEEAARLLDEAGWKDTDGDGVRDRNGKPFEFEVKVGGTNAFYVQTAGLLKDSCKKLGIRMTLRTLEWATFIQDYMVRNFDAAILFHSWSDPFIDSYEAFHSSQDVPNGGNAMGWHHDEADKLLEDMRVVFDDDERTTMYHQFNRIFYEEQPRTLLLENLVGVLVNNRFEEIAVLPAGLRADEWWVKPENVKYD